MHTCKSHTASQETSLYLLLNNTWFGYWSQLYQYIMLVWSCTIRKLFKILLKKVYCCHLLSASYVCSFQNKHLLEIFPFLSNYCQKMSNMRNGPEIVNPCVVMKIKMILKKRLHRCGIKRGRSRHKYSKYKKCLGTIIFICTKQHLI